MNGTLPSYYDPYMMNALTALPGPGGSMMVPGSGMVAPTGAGGGMYSWMPPNAAPQQTGFLQTLAQHQASPEQQQVLDQYQKNAQKRIGTSVNSSQDAMSAARQAMIAAGMQPVQPLGFNEFDMVQRYG